MPKLARHREENIPRDRRFAASVNTNDAAHLSHDRRFPTAPQACKTRS
jgi:hypothetical protein